MPYLRQGQPNVVVAAVLLDTLLTPSTDGVDMVYQQLKDILGVAAAQQAESSMQHWVEVSISTVGRSKAGWQKAAQETPEVGAASTPVRVSAHDRLSHLEAQSEPEASCQNCQGDENAQSQCRVHNPRRRGRDDREGHSLSLEGSGPKVFKSNVCGARFLKHFRVSNNVVKYDSKANLSVWLEDYRLVCRAGGVDDNLFII
jgi:hypothetical protein